MTDLLDKKAVDDALTKGLVIIDDNGTPWMYSPDNGWWHTWNKHYVWKCIRCNETKDCPKEVEEGSKFYDFDTDANTFHELETKGYSILDHSGWYEPEGANQ